MAHKFEIYKDKAGEFRVRFKYNSEVMFSTEGYSSKASAKDAIESIKKNGPNAPIDDATDLSALVVAPWAAAQGLHAGALGLAFEASQLRGVGRLGLLARRGRRLGGLADQGQEAVERLLPVHL